MTSGFTRKSTSVGPWPLKSAWIRSLLVSKYAASAPIVALWPPFVLRTSESLRLTM
jgi:hypothetical protein